MTGGDVHRVILDAADAGKRLDRVLADRIGDHPGLSRTRLQGLIAEGHVAFDGVRVLSPSLKVPGTGLLIVTVPLAVAPEPVAESIPLDIVHEDDDLLVLDKPAGLVVHPAAGHQDGTLVNALIAHCGASLSGIGGVRRPGIVHRLDKDTTGLMVVAKTDAAHEGLSALFADHGRTLFLERRYLAVVWGRPAQAAGTIDRPLGRHPHHREKIAVMAAGKGRRAVTHWRLDEPLGGASLVECRLETGRTHQIRVHMAALGHPLIGDGVYGGGFRSKAARLPPKAATAVGDFKRQALHAATLGFAHPVTGERLTFSRPVPPDLQGLVEALRQDV